MPTSAGTVSESQGVVPLTHLKAWKALQAHYEQVRDVHLRDLFAADPKAG